MYARSQSLHGSLYTPTDVSLKCHHCNYDLILPLLEMYNSIFSTSSIDIQLLKTQMEIAKIELR